MLTQEMQERLAKLEMARRLAEGEYNRRLHLRYLRLERDFDRFLRPYASARRRLLLLTVVAWAFVVGTGVLAWLATKIGFNVRVGHILGIGVADCTVYVVVAIQKRTVRRLAAYYERLDGRAEEMLSGQYIRSN